MPGWPIFWWFNEVQLQWKMIKVAAGKSDSSKYNEVVATKDAEIIDAFSSQVIVPGWGSLHW